MTPYAFLWLSALSVSAAPPVQNQPLQPLYRALDADARAKRPAVAVSFVALCSNAIIDCGNRRLGRGTDLRTNLYWGTGDSTPRELDRDPAWRRVATQRFPRGPVLAAVVHRHRLTRSGLYHLSLAYRGDQIDRATVDWARSAAGGRLVSPVARALRTAIPGWRGRIRLAGYVGHNRLMDRPTLLARLGRVAGAQPAAVWTLACRSAPYFRPFLRRAGAIPLLLTRTLMYPGGFLVRRLLRGIVARRDRPRLAAAAGAAYYRNQRRVGATRRSARRVFWP